MCHIHQTAHMAHSTHGMHISHTRSSCAHGCKLYILVFVKEQRINGYIGSKSHFFLEFNYLPEYAKAVLTFYSKSYPLMIQLL